MIDEPNYDPEQVGETLRFHTWKCENCGTSIRWRFDFRPKTCPYCEEPDTFRRYP